MVADGRDPRVLVGMLEQAGLLMRGYDQGRAFHVEVPPPPADAGERIDELLRRSAAVASERVRRLIGFAESSSCRHAQVAEHFGESFDGACGMCDVCAPVGGRRHRRGSEAAQPLPEDVGAAIVRAVAALQWPLGRTGLTAMLLGSVSAPPSARRSPSFGLLRGATQAEVKRWLKLLEVSGALEVFETEDGFRLLRVVPARTCRGSPRPARPQERRHRPTRACSSACGRGACERARADAVPAYVVLHDATLRALAAAKPRSPADLAAVSGFGPTKLERYGADVLELISAAPG